MAKDKQSKEPKKSGKSIKEKRAEKRAKRNNKQAASFLVFNAP